MENERLRTVIARRLSAGVDTLLIPGPATGSRRPFRCSQKEAFEGAGLPYFNPHSFRDTLAQLGRSKCRSPEEFEAWSKNLGHEHMLKTFRSYGVVDPHRQGALIRSIGAGSQGEAKLDALMRMVGELKDAS